MKNVIFTGATGMVGGLALDYCLNSAEVAQVTSLVRKPSGKSHPKLKEIIHPDFLDYSNILDHFKGQDLAIFCIGVYTGAVPREKFREITIDYTVAFAETLKAQNAAATFCFLSGQGADQTEKSRVMFAKDKGIAENALKRMGFDQLYIFRPGYIYPVTPRKEPNFTYRLMRVLYKPVFEKIYPNIGVASDHLGYAMAKVGLQGGDQMVFENRDIRGVEV